MTETDLCNIALGKIGGAGDQQQGNAFISSIDGSDNVSTFCKFTLPRVRRRSIIDLATRECPFRETIRFADLGAAIADDDTPEIGQWRYAFNLSSDCLAIARQFNENSINVRQHPTAHQTRSNVNYQWETIANKKGNGTILLTNTLSNYSGDSAFIEYAIDIKAVGAFSEQMIECVATLLAAELCPVVGRDMETRATLMQEYYLKSIPDAQRVNQSGFNSTARTVPDLSGGRNKNLRGTGGKTVDFGYIVTPAT